MTPEERSLSFFHAAARAAQLGRRLQDPVMLLAAANLALRAGGETRALMLYDVGDLRSIERRPRIPDARPDINALRDEARAAACDRDEIALVDEIEASLPGPGASVLKLARVVCAVGSSARFVLPKNCAMICVASDGTPLHVEAIRGATAAGDPEAQPTLAFARVPPGVGAPMVRLSNLGSSDAEVLVVWA